LEDSGLLAKPLFQIRLGAYASPEYLAGQAIPDSPADLRAQSCITAHCGSTGEPGDTVVWRLRRGSEVQEVRVESRVGVPDPTINHQLALAGVGVALLSQSVARAAVAEGLLIRLLPEWEPEPVELHAVYPSPLHSSPKVRAFLQFLHDHFASLPAGDSCANPRPPRLAGTARRPAKTRLVR
jgi:DNA-binding transcriptional LysR family regulator